MNKVLEAMKERRSIRSFKSDAVPQELLDQIMEAGLYAANGRGSQNTIIIQVTKKSVRDEIAEMNRKIGGWDEGFDPFYGAPAMLIVLGKKDWPTHVYDGSLVMGNLMLACHELGLGSCWITSRTATETTALPLLQRASSQIWHSRTLRWIR